MNKNLEIKFSGRVNRKAEVSLTKKQFNYRMNGLIQFLSHFASTIEYNIKDADHETLDLDKEVEVWDKIKSNSVPTQKLYADHENTGVKNGD